MTAVESNDARRVLFCGIVEIYTQMNRVESRKNRAPVAVSFGEKCSLRRDKEEEKRKEKKKTGEKNKENEEKEWKEEETWNDGR